MDAAYNLARWLVHNDHDAQDVVQDAYLRAFRFAGGFRGGDPRAWILAIVRNTAFTWLRRNRGSESPTEFDEKIHGGSSEESGLEADAVRKADGAMIRAALDELADEFREVIVMRDIEGLSSRKSPTRPTCRLAPSCRGWRAPAASSRVRSRSESARSDE